MVKLKARFDSLDLYIIDFEDRVGRVIFLQYIAYIHDVTPRTVVADNFLDTIAMKEQEQYERERSRQS